MAQSELRLIKRWLDHFYAKDSRANKLNVQRGFKKLKSIPEIERNAV